MNEVLTGRPQQAALVPPAVPVQTLRMLKAIIRATLTGTAAALTVPAIIFLIALIRSISDPESLWLTIGVGFLASAVMLMLIGCSVVLIGIPASILLRKAGRESHAVYTLLGALSGFSVTLILPLIDRLA